jgi:outer membrane protein OmpA-like peptidoglycan-associated protein
LKFIQCILFSTITLLGANAQDYAIYFDLDKAQLTQTAMQTLKEVAHSDAYTYLQIECHCDSLGTSPYNMDLSRRRAETTKKFLIANGFSPKHIRVAWFGKEQPAYDNRGDERYKNRRCDLRPQRPNTKFEDFTGTKGEEFIIPDLVFVGNQAIPMHHSLPMLDSLYQMVRKTPAKLLIKGHVCCSDEQELSEKRAIQIKRYLISRGISPDRLSWEGYSNKRPLAKEVDAKTREMNRRVEIEVLEALPAAVLQSEQEKPVRLYFELLSLRQTQGKGNLDMQSKFNLDLIAQTLAATPNYTFQFEIFGPTRDRRMHEHLHSEIDMMMRKKGFKRNDYRILIKGPMQDPAFTPEARYVFLYLDPKSPNSRGI